MNCHEFIPCSEWAKYLTMLHEEDFSHYEFVALETHLDSCPTCTLIRREYLALADALTQDVSADPPAEIPPRLRHSLQPTEEVMNVVVDNPEKKDCWKNAMDSFDMSGFDETLYHEVKVPIVRKSLKEDQYSSQYP